VRDWIGLILDWQTHLSSIEAMASEMKQLLFNIGFIIDLVSFVVIFIFPPTVQEEGTGIALEDNTPLGNGYTAGEQREINSKLRARNNLISKIGFIGAIIGMGLMWYSNGLPPPST